MACVACVLVLDAFSMPNRQANAWRAEQRSKLIMPKQITFDVHHHRTLWTNLFSRCCTISPPAFVFRLQRFFLWLSLPMNGRRFGRFAIIYDLPWLACAHISGKCKATTHDDFEMKQKSFAVCKCQRHRNGILLAWIWHEGGFYSVDTFRPQLAARLWMWFAIISTKEMEYK